MIYITFKDYKHEAATLKALVEELRTSNRELQKEVEINRVRLGDAKIQREADSRQIRDLKLKVNDLSSRVENITESLEKQMSDNCELHKLYSDKCKECEVLNEQAVAINGELDNLMQEKATLEEKLKTNVQEGYVVVEEEEYNKLKIVYDKKQIENETRNANRRKQRAERRKNN